MAKVPCLNCENRSPVCHSICSKYLKYRKEQDEAIIKRKAERELSQALYDAKERRFSSLRAKPYKK